MRSELLEHEVQDTHDIEQEKTADDLENSYLRYVELGGIINPTDFKNSLARSKETATLDKARIAQAEIIAHRSGIQLHNSKDSLDPRTILYGILRSEAPPSNPKEAQYHHSQMSDQKLFAESLRMLGDADSLEKLIAAHPNISFDYKSSES